MINSFAEQALSISIIHYYFIILIICQVILRFGLSAVGLGRMRIYVHSYICIL